MEDKQTYHIFVNPTEGKDMTEETTLTLTFEDFANENGITYWWASDFMKMLGYTSLQSFLKPIHRAMQACLTINIDCHNDFVKTDRVVDGKAYPDYKLTRFACYMVAMNSDVKKPQVALAQAYFAKQAETFDLILEGTTDVERLIAREEIKEGHKALTSAAKNAGVQEYARFMDAGYRGLYNRTLASVRDMKGVSQKDNLFDYMGRTELAANLFRITLTEEKLKHQNIKGEQRAINVHNQVGSDVRKMVKDNTGLYPEQLPVERKLGEVTKQLRKANKKLNSKRKEE